VKRYDLIPGQTYSWMGEKPGGRYVLAADAESESAALRAHVERLRALIEQNARAALVMPVQDLRDSLAAANALLERIVKYAREDKAHTSGLTRLARALDEAVAHLAAQPATAPTRFERKVAATAELDVTVLASCAQPALPGAGSEGGAK